jgi:hypothetical protein
MISPERKCQLLNSYLEILPFLQWLDKEDLMKGESNSISLIQRVISYCCVSREERLWLADQINPSAISEEDKELALLSLLQSEITELLLQIDGLYEPLVQYRQCPDFTGCLFNVDDDCILFAFNSLEECIEKMKEFISSY